MIRALIFILLCLPLCGQSLFFNSNYTAALGTVVTPSFDNDTGSYSGSATVTITDGTSGAAIVYCTATGSDCSPVTSYSTPVSITVDTTHLCAKATKNGYTDSATKCATYTITAAPSLALVQQATGTTSGGSSIAVTLPSNVTAGSCLIATLTASQAESVTGITGGGVTWSSVQTSATNLRGAIWKGPNSSGGVKAITINVSGGGNAWANVAEFSGLDAACSKDQSASANGNGTPTVTTASITNTNANDVIVAVGIMPSNFVSGPTNSFVALSTPDNTRFVAAYQIVSGTGTYSTAWTFGGSAAWEAQIASFKR